jgi:dienelactone hydrolase
MMKSMNTIVATDIFGLTKHITDLAEAIRPRRGVIEILDPYQGVRHSFADEAKAYAYFTDHVGLDAYAGCLAEKISNIADNCLVVGFSVGSAAAWKAAGDYAGNNLRAVIGLYGSQIRYHIALTPQCPVTLFFPKSEEHFDVEELINQLKGKDGIECIRTEYLHGFMNPLSQNFDEIGYSKYLVWLTDRIESLTYQA